MAMMTEAERIFYQDVREKKVAGYGAFKKKGKGVKHHMSGIKTPYDFLTAKQKRQLSGEVRVINLYQSVLPEQDFLSYAPDVQKEMLMNWKINHTAKEVADKMGIPYARYYKYLYDFEVIPRPQS